MNFSDWMEHVKRFQDRVLFDLPWVRAAVIITTLSAIYVWLNPKIPENMQLNLFREDWKVSAQVGIVCLYFFLVAIFSNEQLRAERKLRSIDRGFYYDRLGTLYNGGEPNIAFRIETFKGILDGIGHGIGQKELKDNLIKAGRAAAKNFAKEFPGIYDRDLVRYRGGAAWTELNFSEKIRKWAEYDSATGWGIVTTQIRGKQVRVTFTHLNNLFESERSYFAWFLAGYSETLISSIIEKHMSGRHEEFDSAELEPNIIVGANTVKFNCKLV